MRRKDFYKIRGPIWWRYIFRSIVWVALGTRDVSDGVHPSEAMYLMLTFKEACSTTADSPIEKVRVAIVGLGKSW